jgi:hypothetical protein
MTFEQWRSKGFQSPKHGDDAAIKSVSGARIAVIIGLERITAPEEKISETWGVAAAFTSQQPTTPRTLA